MGEALDSFEAHLKGPTFASGSCDEPHAGRCTECASAAVDLGPRGSGLDNTPSSCSNIHVNLPPESPVSSELTPDGVKSAKRPRLGRPSSTLEALKFLGTVLEDSPLTNAGTGSELNQHAQIECDACVITSPKTHHAAVSAVQNVKNPILICTEMLKDSASKSLSAPRFLTSQGAYEYACLKNLKTGSLETQRSRDAFKYWTSRHNVTDTIGLVCVDSDTWAAGSSSGGSLLKFPGRVGPAGVCGAAVDISSDSASICSGFGEDILQVGLARQANTVDDLHDLPDIMMSQYELQRSPYFGVVRVQKTGEKVYLDYFHTTEAMNFAVLDTVTGTRHLHTQGSKSGGWKFDL